MFLINRSYPRFNGLLLKPGLRTWTWNLDPDPEKPDPEKTTP